MSALLAAIGFAGLIVATLALIRGGLGWGPLTTRRRAALGLAVAFAVLIAGGALAPQRVAAPAAGDTVSEPTPSAEATTAVSTSPTTAPPVAAGPTGAAPKRTPTRAENTALALLASIPVKGRAPNTGYSRDEFGQAWADTDRNGCDTRNDVLRRDLTATTIQLGTYGCLVLAGTLHDPYTGSVISFLRGASTSTAVQIDHVVALSDAWQTGAYSWPSRKRLAFANDPLNLLAVDGPANEAKSDADAASWLPSNKGYRCTYVARQTAVKAKYRLWMTAAEHNAIASLLDACPPLLSPAGGTPTLAPFDAPVHRAPTTQATQPRPTRSAAPGSTPDTPPAARRRRTATGPTTREATPNTAGTETRRRPRRRRMRIARSARNPNVNSRAINAVRR